MKASIYIAVNILTKYATFLAVAAGISLQITTTFHVVPCCLQPLCFSFYKVRFAGLWFGFSR